MKENVSNFFSLLREKYPLQRTLCASSISEIFAIHKSLFAIFTIPMNLKPRFFSSSHACTEGKKLSTMKKFCCLFTCKMLSITLVSYNNPSCYLREWGYSPEEVLTRFNCIIMPQNPSAAFWISQPFSGFLSIVIYCGKPAFIQCPPIPYHMGMDSST